MEELYYQPFRIENHLDGPGINGILAKRCPERILWRHLRWIRDNKEKLKHLKWTRIYIKFDAESTVRFV